jgi:hypothetical protein
MEVTHTFENKLCAKLRVVLGDCPQQSRIVLIFILKSYLVDTLFFVFTHILCGLDSNVVVDWIHGDFLASKDLLDSVEHGQGHL